MSFALMILLVLRSIHSVVYDFERVYTSDMKKMIKWFEVIQSNDIDFTQKTVEEASDEAVVVEETTEETATKKPAAKKAAKPKAKKEAAPESEVTAADETEKPKRGRKKKTEE